MGRLSFNEEKGLALAKFYFLLSLKYKNSVILTMPNKTEIAYKMASYSSVDLPGSETANCRNLEKLVNY